MRDASGAWTDRIYGPGGALATVPGTQGGQPTYRISDHLGSLSYTLSPAGTIQGASTVYPFGQSGSNSTTDNFLFTGHERDTENFSDETLYRHYSSSQGRWLSPDPANGSYNLADPQSLNRYSYVNNRPMADEDELGLQGGGCPCSCPAPAPPSNGGGFWDEVLNYLFGNGADYSRQFQDSIKGLWQVGQVNVPSRGAGFSGGRTGTAVGTFSRDHVPAQQQAAGGGQQPSGGASTGKLRIPLIAVPLDLSKDGK